MCQDIFVYWIHHFVFLGRPVHLAWGSSRCLNHVGQLLNEWAFMIYTISMVPYLFVACFMDPFRVIHVILANLLCMYFCSTSTHGGSLTWGDSSHAYAQTYILMPNLLYMCPVFHALLLYLRKLRYHPLHIFFDINDNIYKMGYFFYP